MTTPASDSDRPELAPLATPSRLDRLWIHGPGDTLLLETTSDDDSSADDSVPHKVRATVAFVMTGNDRRQIGLNLAPEVGDKITSSISQDAMLITEDLSKIEDPTEISEVSIPKLVIPRRAPEDDKPLRDSDTGPAQQRPLITDVESFRPLQLGSPSTRVPAFTHRLGEVKYEDRYATAYLRPEGDVALATETEPVDDPGASRDANPITPIKPSYETTLSLENLRRALDKGTLTPEDDLAEVYLSQL